MLSLATKNFSVSNFLVIAEKIFVQGGYQYEDLSSFAPHTEILSRCGEIRSVPFATSSQRLAPPDVPPLRALRTSCGFAKFAHASKLAEETSQSRRDVSRNFTKTMAKNDIILERVNYLLDLGGNTLKSQWTTSDSLFIHYHVNPELHKEFESASLSFIVNLYGEKHPFFTQFQENVKSPNPSCIKNGIGILKSIKTEIEKGWLITLKGLVVAEFAIAFPCFSSP